MQSLGFEQKNPTIYNMIAELDYDNREVDFEEFLGAIIDKLGDKVKNKLNLFYYRKPKKASTRFSTSSTKTAATPSTSLT
jgi:hypothetical protein